MEDYLLVVDMQSDYVAAGKAYDNEALTAAVNDKLPVIPATELSILNRFFWERKDRKKKFATGLQVVSSRIFEKRWASCFTNPDLKDFLEGNGAKSIEFIGVDGNGCVKASVLAAVKENYQVSIDLSAVGVANQKKFSKTLKQWQDCGIKIG
ncbi:cysteine hydrolase [Streptococcus sanguinis]|uniref:Cysteine hydrolase n=1 Tax=Streptococcus sanguinis TaxID=1305 RepID=A0A7Y0VC25_STRSA|nr:cysteine hydrolase [Streptococcus sanguinis]